MERGVIDHWCHESRLDQQQGDHHHGHNHRHTDRSFPLDAPARPIGYASIALSEKSGVATLMSPCRSIRKRSASYRRRAPANTWKTFLRLPTSVSTGAASRIL